MDKNNQYNKFFNAYTRYIKKTLPIAAFTILCVCIILAIIGITIAYIS